MAAQPPLDQSIQTGQEPPEPPKPPKPPKPPENIARRPDPTVPSASTKEKTEDAQLDVSQIHMETIEEPFCRRFKRYCYNRNAGTYCGRTCMSWLKITVYAIMYLVFLITYFNILLYISLLIIKHENLQGNSLSDYADINYDRLVQSLPDTVGLSGTPLSEFNFPLIWYRNGEPADYERYMSALDELLSTNRGRKGVQSTIGPCGERPYGYGDKPCILIRINRQNRWAVRPMTPNSLKFKEAPQEIQQWVMRDSKKYWLHCQGHQNYDKEHVGAIKYYPDPPGFDSKLYPVKENSSVPLVAVQLSNFTLGISIALQCSVWYEAGFSSIHFVLYISPRSKF